jgi:hypothetical protein
VDPCEIVHVLIQTLRSSIDIWRFLERRKPHAISKRLIKEVFPQLDQPLIVTTGQLTDSSHLDPEDKLAADAIAQVVLLMAGKSKAVNSIQFIRSLKLIDLDKHVVAFGSARSNPLNSGISYFGGNGERPSSPLFLSFTSRARKRTIRHFNGCRHERPLWCVIDRITGERLVPETDNDGWLTRDFLLISVLPLPQNQTYLVSFAGLYGTGTMGTKLLLANKNGVLDSILASKGKAVCFQALCSVYDIDHAGQFSLPGGINHLRTYPL